MQELILSIAKEYDLPGFEPNTRKVIIKSIEERNHMVGTYQFPELGEANVAIKENGLEIDGEFTDEPIFLLPETDSTYFNRKSGTYYTFLFEGENVTGIKFWKYTGEKTE
jgi:hypothetical protein